MLVPFVYPLPSDHRVVDGDTLYFPHLDLGFYHAHISPYARLYGIDTPEKSTLSGKLVKDVVEDLLTVTDYSLSYLQSVEKPDKYSNRFLARVHLALPFTMRTSIGNSSIPSPIPDTLDLSQILIYLGLALTYEGEKKTKWSRPLLEAVSDNAISYINRSITHSFPPPEHRISLSNIR